MSRQSEFTSKVYKAGLDAGLPDHIARLAATQAALESGYGKSVKGNNYFGIKAGKSWGGKTQSFTTHENYNGKRTKIVDKFRAYDDPADSLRDWAETISKKWPGVMKSRNFDEAVRQLNNGVHGAYATDPKYGSKLNFIQSKFLPKGSPQTAVSALGQFAPPHPQAAPNRISFAPEKEQVRPLITPIPPPSLAYGTRGAPTPLSDPRRSLQPTRAIQPTLPKTLSTPRGSKPLPPKLKSPTINEYVRDPKSKAFKALSSKFGMMPQPLAKTSKAIKTGMSDKVPAIGEIKPIRQPGRGYVPPVAANQKVRIAGVDPSTQAGRVVMPGRPQSIAPVKFEAIRPGLQMNGVGQGAKFSDLAKFSQPINRLPQRQAPPKFSRPIVPQVQRAPITTRVALRRPQIDPNDHNQAALQAISEGRNSYVNSSGSVQPTRAPNGNYRKTYGD